MKIVQTLREQILDSWNHSQTHHAFWVFASQALKMLKLARCTEVQECEFIALGRSASCRQSVSKKRIFKSI